MKKLFLFPMLCFCLLLSACGAEQSSSSAPPTSAQAGASFTVPLKTDSPYIFIEVKNTTAMQGDLRGTVLALMQSEYGAMAADTAAEADYIIHVDIHAFHQLGSESRSASTAEVAIPAVAGAALGAQIGGSFSGKGGLVGAGIGLVAGVMLGSATGGEEVLVWQAQMQLKVQDRQGKNYASKLMPQAKGQNMDALTAAANIENTAAWSVVRAFKKEN